MAAPSSAAMSTAPNSSERIAGAAPAIASACSRAGVALDDHVQADGPRRALQQRLAIRDLLRGLDLGQHDRIGRARMLDDREQVLEAEGVRTPLIRTTRSMPSRGALEQGHRRARAASLCGGITASSRSTVTMSGPAASALGNRSGRVPARTAGCGAAESSRCPCPLPVRSTALPLSTKGRRLPTAAAAPFMAPPA